MTYNSATGTLNPRLTTDELDEIIRDIARDITSGVLDEATGRMRMLEAVHRTGLVRQATMQWCSRSNIPAHLWDDMTDLAEKFYRDKILVLEDSEQLKPETDRFFSVTVLAGTASASGSIRQALRSAMVMERTLLRRARRIHRPEFVYLDSTTGPGQPNPTQFSALPMAQHENLLAANTPETVAVDAADGTVRGAVLLLDHERRVRSARGPARLAARAETVRQMYGLPRTLRPLDPADRGAICRWVSENPERALRSVRFVLGLVDGDAIDATIAQVWADYHHDHLEEILSTRAPAPVAELLVMDAVQELARPTEVAVRRAVNQIKALLSGAGKPASWATDLVRTYVAAECADHPSVDASMMYRSMLAQATRIPGQPLGEDRMAVRDNLVAITQSCARPRGRATAQHAVAA